MRPILSASRLQPVIQLSLAYVVDDHVDTLNIDTTAENVGGDQDTLLERLELLEPGDTTKSATGPGIEIETYRSG